MQKVAKQVGKEEFLRQINVGRKDFSKTDFQVSMNLKGLALKNLDMRDVSLIESKITGGALDGSYMRDAEFNRSALNGVKFEKTDLRGANFEDAEAKDALFKNSYLCNTYFNRTKLNGSDFDGAFLGGTYFLGADLRGVKNLEKAHMLGYAIFINAIVEKDVKEVIEQAMRNRKPMFIEL
ncbi:MAG: pentapeptide repeat-containing protein [Candidatus Micrarchaeota archaeon]|nr:pentapeptide repeat-containing protein [Candidatus Micrarchaeota archaeon]MDE1847950.1 pentapeptide repeat-containing protein [Candidatus Micrarchaeota archaeon]MDE1864332.1 pentapeptide repeat-containing protein [Candidatus Micrarchaeota archaeon]